MIDNATAQGKALRGTLYNTSGTVKELKEVSPQPSTSASCHLIEVYSVGDRAPNEASGSYGRPTIRT